MDFTPSAKSSVIAGIGLSIVGWTTMFHFDEIAELLRISNWITRDRIFDWIVKHKTLAFMFGEWINFGYHGVENPNSVWFACGSTIVNFIVIFLILPFTFKRRLAKVIAVRAIS